MPIVYNLYNTYVGSAAVEKNTNGPRWAEEFHQQSSKARRQHLYWMCASTGRKGSISTVYSRCFVTHAYLCSIIGRTSRLAALQGWIQKKISQVLLQVEQSPSCQIGQDYYDTTMGMLSRSHDGRMWHWTWAFMREHLILGNNLGREWTLNK